MVTKTELVIELARLTGGKKKDFQTLKKDELIVLLHETRKRKDLRPKRSKHVWLVSPRSRPKRSSTRKSRQQPKRSKHVWLVSPRSRPKRRRKSPTRRRTRRRTSRRRKSPSPKRRRRSRRSSRRSSRLSSRRRQKGVTWGGKHVLFGTPKRHHHSRKQSRGILKPTRSYRAQISYSPKKTKRQILAAVNTRSPTPKKRSRSRSRRGPTKKYYIDELARITGQTKTYYKSWSKDELEQRLVAISEEEWVPKRGKHVWLVTPPKRRTSHRRNSRSRRRRSRSKRRSQKKEKTPCKSYQERNENGRCVNKHCKEGQIRDKVTKKCRNKKR